MVMILSIDLPHLVLLIFHAVDQHLLVRAHLLNDEVVLAMGKVSSRGTAIGRSCSRLVSLYLILSSLNTIRLVQMLVATTSASLAHQVRPTLWWIALNKTSG